MDLLAKIFLKKYATKLFRNLDSTVLDLGIFSGKINLRNVELNPEAVSSLNIPVVIYQGFVGDLRVTIPWATITNKPVEVFIDRIYVLCGPQPWASEVQVRDKKMKHWILKMHTKALLTSLKSAKLPSVPKFIAKIVMNVQVKVSNIHVRFEDKFSNPERMFAVGCTIEQILLSTQAAMDPAPPNVRDNVALKTKVLNITNLAVYLDSNPSVRLADPTKTGDEVRRFFDGNDAVANFASVRSRTFHAYILSPMSISMTMRLNGSADYQVLSAKVTVAIEDHIRVVLTRRQFEDLVAMMSFFTWFRNFAEHIKFRPTVPAGIAPRLWWKYAVKCVLHDLRLSRRPTWPALVQQEVFRAKYMRLFRSRALGRTEDLEQMEAAMSVLQITRYRTQAFKAMYQEGLVLGESNGQLVASRRLLRSNSNPPPMPRPPKGNKEEYTEPPSPRAVNVATGFSKPKHHTEIESLKTSTRKLIKETNRLFVLLTVNISNIDARLIQDVQTGGILEVCQILHADVTGIHIRGEIRKRFIKAELAINDIRVSTLPSMDQYGPLLQKKKSADNFPGQHSSATPFIKVTLERLGANSVRELFLTVTISPLDVLVTSRALSGLLSFLVLVPPRKLMRKWIGHKVWPKDFFMQEDIALHLILKGIQLRGLMERTVLFEPHGILNLPALELTYRTREFQSILRLVRQTIQRQIAMDTTFTDSGVSSTSTPMSSVTGFTVPPSTTATPGSVKEPPTPQTTWDSEEDEEEEGDGSEMTLEEAQEQIKLLRSHVDKLTLLLAEERQSSTAKELLFENMTGATVAATIRSKSASGPSSPTGSFRPRRNGSSSGTTSPPNGVTPRVSIAVPEDRSAAYQATAVKDLDTIRRSVTPLVRPEERALLESVLQQNKQRQQRLKQQSVVPHMGAGTPSRPTNVYQASRPKDSPTTSVVAAVPVPSPSVRTSAPSPQAPAVPSPTGRPSAQGPGVPSPVGRPSAPARMEHSSAQSGHAVPIFVSANLVQQQPRPASKGSPDRGPQESTKPQVAQYPGASGAARSAAPASVKANGPRVSINGVIPEEKPVQAGAGQGSPEDSGKRQASPSTTSSALRRLF